MAGRTPNPGDTYTGQQAVSLPPEYLALNTPQNPAAGATKYWDDRYQQSGYVPQGMEVANGHLQMKAPGWLWTHPWVWAALGIGGGAAAAFATGAFAGAGAGSTATTLGTSAAGPTLRALGDSSLGNTPYPTDGSGAVTGTLDPTGGTGGGGGGGNSFVSGLLRQLLPAGLNLFGANLAANASTEAARIQALSAAQALDYLKQKDAQARADQAPWMAAGRAALGANVYGLGLTADTSAQPPASTASTTAPPTSSSGPAPSYGTPPGIAPPQPGNPSGSGATGPGQPPITRGVSLGAVGMPPSGGVAPPVPLGTAQVSPPQQGPPPQGPSLSTLGQPTNTVKMLAPDGKELFDANPEDVWHYKQRGARVVS
jgi:hypothetical protein